MARELATIDERVEWLAEELLLLKENIDDLHGRVSAIEQGGIMLRPAAGRADETGAAVSLAAPPVVEEDDSGEKWTAVGRDVVLPRAAAVSFLLVVALTLRTVTDNGMVGLMAGSVAGMVYAVGLLAAGAVLFARGSAVAPVFPLCGVLLMDAILVETRANFHALGPSAAYALLLAVDAAAIAVALRFAAKRLLFVTVFASTFAGVAMDFPDPNFVMLGLLILMNTMAAQRAAAREMSHSLSWYVLILSVLYWMFWSYKLNYALRFRPENLAGSGLSAFPVLLFLHWAWYTGSALRCALVRGLELSAFYNVLPAVAAGGAFFAVNAVVVPWLGGAVLVGWGATLASALYMALVIGLARRMREDVPGGKEFVTAATVLLVQGVSVVLPPLWALPLWTAAASILTVWARRWRSGGIRVISYVFHVFIVVVALRHGALAPGGSAPLPGAAVAAVLALMVLSTYVWCRRHPPRCDSVFFTLFDKKDVSAVCLLLIGLYEVFCVARFGIAALAGSMTAANFHCAESVIANLGLALLFVVALRCRSREMLVVGGLLVSVAAVKVFLFDLLKGNGLPLVASVFSFGLLTVTASLVLKRFSPASSEEVGVGGEA